MAMTQERYDQLIEILRETGNPVQHEEMYNEEIRSFVQLARRETVELEAEGYPFKAYINAEDVDKIYVDLQTDKPTYRYLEPKTELEARYSLSCGIALALLDGELTSGSVCPCLKSRWRPPWRRFSPWNRRRMCVTSLIYWSKMTGKST